jgi:hypothetical protein
MLIKVKKVPVKAHNSVKQVKQYYTLLCCAYKILKTKLKNKHINKEIILQMAIKAVNDLAGPNKIVLTLLVFGLYLRIIKIDVLLPIIVKRAKAIYAATKKVRRLYTKRQVNNALAIHNSLNTIAIINLLLQSDVYI